MDDSGIVGRCHARGDVAHDARGLVDGHRTLVEDPVQRPSLEVLHDDHGNT